MGCLIYLAWTCLNRSKTVVLKLNYKKVVIGILILGFLSLYFLYNPSHVKVATMCPFHVTTGMHCPGCGSIRAMDDLIHLKVLNALSHNALLIVSLFLSIAIFLYSRENFNRIVKHPKSFYIGIVVICLFWILRNLDFPPFHYLAP